MEQLSKDVQSLISASYHVNTYAAAVAELVFNSLDASSSSIAIRINIIDKKIQVVDNGYGVRRSDFDLLGHKFATSKFGNKSDQNPSLYGYRGLALATIIEVCKQVTITSHYQGSQETYKKIFYKGESKGIFRTDHRPSKGTTVEVRGFLYNLKLQQNAIESTNELQAIKAILEQLSLLCVSVSFSLRDDAKNMILFKINKNRDLYTTLLSLFDIKSSEYQEFLVEKSDYKLKAFVGKGNISSKNYQWIYLNNKFIHKSKIHSIMNTNLMNCLGIKKKISKMHHFQELEVNNQVLPFYFLFVSCPSIDYDLINAKLTTVEFKNWDQITSLLEKLVQCYSGDIQLIEICNKKCTNQLEAKHNTREEVKRIMEKILVNNTKKQKTLQIHNGAKGKNIKRKKLNLKKQTQNNQIKTRTKSPLDKSLKKTVVSKTPIILTPQLNNYDIQCKNYKTKSKDICKKKNGNTKKNNKTPLMNNFIDPSDSLKKRCKMLSQAARMLKSHSSPMKVLSKQQNKNDKKQMELDIYHGKSHLEEIYHGKSNLEDIYHGKSQLEHKISKDDNTAVMSTYDLVNTILNNRPWKNSEINHLKHTENNEIRTDLQEPYQQSSKDKTIISTKLTYESHAYNVTKQNHRSRHYISNASRMNFQDNRVSHYNFRSMDRFKNPYKLNKSTLLKTLKLCAKDSFHTIDVSSTIHKFNYQSTVQHNILWDITDDIDKPVSNIANRLDNNLNPVCGTYSIDPDLYIQNTNSNINMALDITYSIQLTRNSALTPSHNIDDLNCNIENNLIINDDINIPTQISNTNESLEICAKNTSIFRSQEKVAEKVEPLRVCETIYSDTSEGMCQQIGPNLNLTKVDSLFDGSFNNSDSVGAKHDNVTPNITSHHFPSLLTEEINDIFQDTFNIDNSKPNAIIYDNMININEKNLDAFTIERRCNFMPKGMSPIIKNCNIKLLNPIEDDYFDDTIYKKFAASVLETAQVFEQNVQNVNELITHETNKVNDKMKKDNADLIFNSESLKLAKVLEQVDKKFIATLIPGKTATSQICSDFLVLFDQHAVHERILLENNLSEYLDGTMWQTEKIDPISFTIPKDDLVFLHNYKDRLNTFGLQWSINESLISVYAIPKAILGKATRQVDVILKAVKSLIAELIESLKFLKGNIPQYPQTIMSLVFSEACRYAIMFGDQLSKDNCVELLQSLSQCKTPFQCAHGRPVMAVIMEIDKNKHEYKINCEKLKRFARTK